MPTDTAEPTQKCVLVIDDVALVRRMVGSVCTKAGHRVVEAQNGEEALSLAKMDPPDLIILDVTMPVKGGLETLRELREDPDFQSTPVIMLTSDSDRETVQDMMLENITDYIVKDTTANIVNRLQKHVQSL